MSVSKTVRLSGRESAVLLGLLLVRETGNNNIIQDGSGQSMVGFVSVWVRVGVSVDDSSLTLI